MEEASWVITWVWYCEEVKSVHPMLSVLATWGEGRLPPCFRKIAPFSSLLASADLAGTNMAVLVVTLVENVTCYEGRWLIVGRNW
jgi:hypothetical protein